MIDFLDAYYYASGFEKYESNDAYLAKRKAFSSVLPAIIKNELTQKQSICLRYKYLDNMTQCEIAEKLKLSQPTVSRHINSARDIVNNKLKYCYLALSTGLDEYDRLAQ